MYRVRYTLSATVHRNRYTLKYILYTLRATELLQPVTTFTPKFVTSLTPSVLGVTPSTPEFVLHLQHRVRLKSIVKLSSRRDAGFVGSDHFTKDLLKCLQSITI